MNDGDDTYEIDTCLAVQAYESLRRSVVPPRPTPNLIAPFVAKSTFPIGNERIVTLSAPRQPFRLGGRRAQSRQVGLARCHRWMLYPHKHRYQRRTHNRRFSVNTCNMVNLGEFSLKLLSNQPDEDGFQLFEANLDTIRFAFDTMTDVVLNGQSIGICKLALTSANLEVLTHRKCVILQSI